MPINAKVKETGELFEAINEENLTSGVNTLEGGKAYSGFLYTGQFDSAKAIDGYTVFRRTEEDRTPASFAAEKLEQISGPVKIKAKRKKEDY